MLVSVTHFETYAENLAKLADFSHAIFGWKLKKVGQGTRIVRRLRRL